MLLFGENNYCNYDEETMLLQKIHELSCGGNVDGSQKQKIHIHDNNSLAIGFVPCIYDVQNFLVLPTDVQEETAYLVVAVIVLCVVVTPSVDVDKLVAELRCPFCLCSFVSNNQGFTFVVFLVVTTRQQ